MFISVRIPCVKSPSFPLLQRGMTGGASCLGAQPCPVRSLPGRPANADDGGKGGFSPCLVACCFARAPLPSTLYPDVRKSFTLTPTLSPQGRGRSGNGPQNSFLALRPYFSKVVFTTRVISSTGGSSPVQMRICSAPWRTNMPSPVITPHPAAFASRSRRVSSGL
jgi:hypothetical protein